jgi:signal transduction histidine kinase
MPLNPWLAMDASTPPALRARELRREWEQFLSGGQVGAVRRPVADSWQRSLEAGVDPSGGNLAPVVLDRDEAAERWDLHPLAEAAPLIRECLGNVAHESDHLIVVTDAAGMLLQLEGSVRVRSKAADINFTEGALWSEEGAGTNAIGTALAADHAVEIFATEHFNEVVQVWTCSAAPVHDPETGELLGVIDLTGLQRDLRPHSLAVAMTTARAVEGHLRHRMEERDNRLRARYSDQLATGSGRRALVGRSGRLLADDASGWLRGTQLELPPGGGELILPSGAYAVAEPVGPGEAFVVREGHGRRRSRDQLRMLTDEQAALRRLAAAVAQGGSPAEILTAVASEIGPLLGANDAALVRFEPDRSAAVVAGVGEWADERSIGTRSELERHPAITEVRRSGRSARVDDRERSAVASPIVVEGGLWGAMIASTKGEPLSENTEQRMGTFTELVAIVIANAESRAELTASRSRLVAAGDEARRRMQRDLHDGAQQRLVSTIATLKLARRELGEATGSAVDLLDEALTHAEGATRELRELAHGILPGALTRGGLSAGIQALVSRAHLPVAVEVTSERLPAALEATAYFIVAEALTNIVRHADASSAQIVAEIDGEVLRLAVRDDGVGGARSDRSSGLLGLRDRAAALNGELRIESPPGGGTVVAATLPIPA